MKVILLQDVIKVGRRDQIVDVSDGYATNFLFKKKLAVPADDFHVKELKNKQLRKEEELKKQKEEALILAKRMEKISLEFFAKPGKDGRMFGSVTGKMIEQELRKFQANIDKRKIEPNHITSFGVTIVKIELFKDVYGAIKVSVKEQV